MCRRSDCVLNPDHFMAKVSLLCYWMQLKNVAEGKALGTATSGCKKCGEPGHLSVPQQSYVRTKFSGCEDRALDISSRLADALSRPLSVPS